MKYKASDIAALLQGELLGNPNAEVWDFRGIEEATEGCISFIGDAKWLRQLSCTRASVVLVSASLKDELPETHATIILVENARGAVAQLMQMVEEVLRPRKRGIEQPCFIAEGVTIPDDAYVGAFAYIAKGAQIGRGAQIYPNTYIGENVRIGDNTILYAGAKIYYNCIVGQGCILHSGCVIGADGFGFEPDAQGVNRKIPQIGNVVVDDDVEIGANTTIDRAMFGTTHIGRNTKLDNLVQIGHNSELGEANFVCAQVGMAGTTKVGNHCIFAGQVGVAGHLTIADGCIFGAQSGIPKSVAKPGMYQGSPIQDALAWRKSSVVFKQLPELQKRVQALENV